MFVLLFHCLENDKIYAEATKEKIPDAESVYLTLHLQRLYNIAQAGTAEVC